MAKSNGYVCVVYDPPRPGLPYLAVMIKPDGEVSGMAFADPETAQQFVDELGKKLSVED